MGFSATSEAVAQAHTDERGIELEGSHAVAIGIHACLEVHALDVHVERPVLINGNIHASLQSQAHAVVVKIDFADAERRPPAPDERP